MKYEVTVKHEYEETIEVEASGDWQAGAAALHQFRESDSTKNWKVKSVSLKINPNKEE